MKKIITLTIAALVALPLCAPGALAEKKSTKDAGIYACTIWCAENRTGKQFDKCVNNCDCYYKLPSCEKKSKNSLEQSVPLGSSKQPVLKQ